MFSCLRRRCVRLILTFFSFLTLVGLLQSIACSYPWCLSATTSSFLALSVSFILFLLVLHVECVCCCVSPFVTRNQNRCKWLKIPLLASSYIKKLFDNKTRETQDEVSSKETTSVLQEGKCWLLRLLFFPQKIPRDMYTSSSTSLCKNVMSDHTKNMLATNFATTAAKTHQMSRGFMFQLYCELGW